VLLISKTTVSLLFAELDRSPGVEAEFAFPWQVIVLIPSVEFCDAFGKPSGQPPHATH
jgi:hypothetical protein